MRIVPQGDALPYLYSARLLLRAVQLTDICDEYLKWLNSPVVNQYLEVRHVQQTRAMVEEYIAGKLKDTRSSMHYGLFLPADGNRFIGTVTMNDINYIHRRADISFVVGCTDVQGKGYGSEAVHALCAYAFHVCQMHKITGGHYRANEGSRQVFLKTGFSQETVLREHFIDAEGNRTDALVHSLFAKDFAPNSLYLGDNGEVLLGCKEEGK